MKKLLTTILTTSVAAAALLFTGATADAATTYTVKSGDSVWAISQKFNTTINAVEHANNISNHFIHPGQTLTIGDTTATSTSTAATTSTSATTSSTTSSSTASSSTGSTSTYTGNNLKSYVLSQMQSRTGVSASTWNAIITRESNWQPNVVNASSGAYGLFQNMHISSGSVEEQVNAAVALYNAQGMQAWAL